MKRNKRMARRQPHNAHAVGQHCAVHVMVLNSADVGSKAQAEALLEERGWSVRETVWRIVPVVGHIVSWQRSLLISCHVKSVCVCAITAVGTACTTSNNRGKYFNRNAYESCSIMMAECWKSDLADMALPHSPACGPLYARLPVSSRYSCA